MTSPDQHHGPLKRRSFAILILDRYIFREFVISFIAVISFCSLLLLVATIFEKFQDIMTSDTPMDKAIQYFAFGLPFKVMQVVPIASMLAVLFSIGTLARNNEVLAFLTSGVHGLRLAAPVIFGGVLIVIGSIAMNEILVPPLQQKAKRLEDLYLRGKDEGKITTQRNVMTHGRESRFYLARLYSTTDKRMFRPTIVDMAPDNSGLTRRIEADSAIFKSNDREGRKSEWVLHNPRIWDFNDQGKIAAFKEMKADIPVLFEEDLTTLLSQKKQPEEMNYGELKEHIRILEERAQPTSGLKTDLISKITFPLGILVIMIIGFSYAARTRGGNAMSAFGYGILWAFLFYAATAFAKALGHSGRLSPFMAGNIANIVFAIIALRYLRRSYRWHS